MMGAKKIKACDPTEEYQDFCSSAKSKTAQQNHKETRQNIVKTQKMLNLIKKLYPKLIYFMNVPYIAF